MTIDKQLFEDILNGKIKGTFLLSNGLSVKSNRLCRNMRHLPNLYPYTLKGLPIIYSNTGAVSSVEDHPYRITRFMSIPAANTQASVHPEFAQSIEKCLEYADEWRNPLRNDAGGSDQFRIIYNHLVEIKQELNK